MLDMYLPIKEIDLRIRGVIKGKLPLSHNE